MSRWRVFCLYLWSGLRVLTAILNIQITLIHQQSKNWVLFTPWSSEIFHQSLLLWSTGMCRSLQTCAIFSKQFMLQDISLERINATKITGGDPPTISPFVPFSISLSCPERGSSCPVMLSISGWTVLGRKVPVQDTTKQQICFHLWCYRASKPRRTSGFGTKSKSSNPTSSLSNWSLKWTFSNQSECV